MAFHSKDGWFFERQADGSVWIYQRSGGKADGEIVATVVLDPDTWASVMASMSIRGETGETFQQASLWHNDPAANVRKYGPARSDPLDPLPDPFEED